MNTCLGYAPSIDIAHKEKSGSISPSFWLVNRLFFYFVDDRPTM